MRVLFLLAAVALGAATAGAQTSSTYVGRPVERIDIVVAGQPTIESTFADLVEARVGEPLSMTAVRESIAHLYSLGRFQDVQVDATQTPEGGVRLRFDLVPLLVVRRIAFTGDVQLSEGLLRDTVTDRLGSSPSIGRAEEAARTLEQLYRDYGYLRAAVRPSETLPDPERGALTFVVRAGPRARIGEVTITGTSREPRPALLRRLQASPGEPFRRGELQRRVDEYVRQLRRRGFYYATGTVQPSESSDGTAVDIILDIEPGPAVTVRFQGDPVPGTSVNDLVLIERESSVDEDLLEDSEANIEGYLREQGYWKADVTVLREEAPGRLAIVFDVRRGLQYRIAAPVDVQGNQAVPIGELRPLIPLERGALYVADQLSVAASAIRELYRRRGFASVDVKTAANEINPVRPGEGLVQPVIVTTEGPLTVIDDVQIVGNEAVSADRLRGLITSAPGAAYYEPRTLADRDALILEYGNLGFASATVSVSPELTEDRTRATLIFQVREGPQTIVDHILIVGNTNTDPQIILREMQLRPGAPLGLEDLFESRRRLSALGLFRRVRITELTHGSTNRHDILVTVDEAPATTVGYGGGVEATQRLRATGPGGEAEEKLEFAPRGFFDIGRRNVGGKNRSVNLYTRVSLRPNDAPDDPERDGTGLGFSEYRVVGTYRQPRVLGPNDMTVTAAVEQGVRSSFNFTRKGVNADLSRRLRAALRASVRYSFSTTRTFDERFTDEEDQEAIDRLFPQVRLSGFAGTIVRDTRDDVVDPAAGTFASAEGSVAARALGGQVGFMKMYVQGFWFRRLPGPRRIVFAARTAVGVADGFERTALPPDGVGDPISVEDLPASERFFAGGDTTIRGFALDRVGAANTVSANGFPTGGNAVLILNGEMRVPVWREVGAAFFVDGGNVFRRVTEFDLGDLRGSVGFGIRYGSPIGPVRFDLGFKMDRREIAGTLEPSYALHFSIGQAF